MCPFVLFNKPFSEAHNPTADVEATTRCFLDLFRLEEYTKEQLDVQPDYFQNFKEVNPEEIQLIGLRHINLKKESDKIRERLKNVKTESISTEEIKQNIFFPQCCLPPNFVIP